MVFLSSLKFFKIFKQNRLRHNNNLLKPDDLINHENASESSLYPEYDLNFVASVQFMDFLLQLLSISNRNDGERLF